MKTLTSRIVVLTVIVLCAVAAMGQSNAMLKADIPFNFTIGEKQFASGSYVLTSQAMGVECLRDADGKAITFFATNPSGKITDGNAKLIFHRYGERYLLAELYRPSSAAEVRISKKALRLAQSKPTENVAVAMEPVRP